MGLWKKNNYRPVSSLPFVSKLEEKCIQKQFNDHCNEVLLNSDYQGAYKARYSCETALLKIANDLLWAMERGNISALILMKHSAAFNTVDHEILVSLLEKKFEIRDVALKWLREYLQPRFFKVCVKCIFK